MMLRHHDLVAEMFGYVVRSAIDASRRTWRITRTHIHVRIHNVGACIIHVYSRVRARTCRTNTRIVRYRATLRRPFALVARLFGGLASHRLRAAISLHPSRHLSRRRTLSTHVIFLFLRVVSSISLSFSLSLSLSPFHGPSVSSASSHYQRRHLRRCPRVALKKSRLSFFRLLASFRALKSF